VYCAFLKLARYSRVLQSFRRVIGSKEEMTLITLFLIVVLVIASSFMYFIEKDVRPGVFSSLRAAIWSAYFVSTTCVASSVDACSVHL
jgi:voltage-gated potassium channel